MINHSGASTTRWQQQFPHLSPTQARQKHAEPIRLRVVLCLVLYGFIALTTIVEAATREPVLASAAANAIARLHGATPHPNPPTWAVGANILIAPILPGDQLAFAGGSTIVLTQQAMHDDGTIAHELVHVDQYRRHTTFGATIIYLTHAIKLLIQTGGDLETTYFHHPFELEAYRVQFGPQWDEALTARARP